MRWQSSHLAQTLPQPVIDAPKSYWASHFYAVLQCLHYQRNLDYKPSNLRTFPHWTLASLRGTMETNFFNQLRAKIQNHGFEYFLINFLNLKLGSYIVDSLIKRVLELWGEEYSPTRYEYMFYIAGKDSALSDGIDFRFVDIFPDGSPFEKEEVIERADLCLVLTDKINGIKNAIFGEVEGNNGNDLLLASYWRRRPRLSVFSIGIGRKYGQSNGNESYIVNNVHDYLARVHIHFESNHYVVIDFEETIDFFHHIFLMGPNSRYTHREDEFLFFADMIAKNFETPMPQLLSLLYSYVDGRDTVHWAQPALPIITDITA